MAARIDPFTPVSHEIDEQALLAGLRAGDEGAYERLVRAFGGRMLAVAIGILRNEDDARDAVQTAYLSAFRALPSFAGQCRLSTWLHRIVVNAALMRLRSRRRKPEEAFEDLLPTFLEDGHHAAQYSRADLPPDDVLEREETRATVRECIAQLPEHHRSILVMRDIEDVSTGEVAALLGITPNAVKIRLHRARQALATLLRREFQLQTVAGAPAAAGNHAAL
jgi:RNA polymerase sigma-70 factor (ECF subfamily)